ncbi:hypothetical protein GX51_06822 [Blastomyces parvus]|uniref:Uncharacterized protein n=1 Tax=Blastomyces parvus TaxID=2060905 RepID=A0A2B7WPD1_9EURO|nr:hypothetical protein GX51_06822 [Blastomyces parvus]
MWPGVILRPRTGIFINRACSERFYATRGKICTDPPGYQIPRSQALQRAAAQVTSTDLARWGVCRAGQSPGFPDTAARASEVVKPRPFALFGPECALLVLSQAYYSLDSRNPPRPDAASGCKQAWDEAPGSQNGFASRVKRPPEKPLESHRRGLRKKAWF